ncbi:MAG: RsmE family RNA methyltransferase [Gemmatimonadota bacterium]
MIRLLVDRLPDEPPAAVELSEEEAHHARVRRIGDDEEVELIDGRGRIGTGRVTLGKREGQVVVESVVRVPPSPAIVLLVGSGDRERFTWLVEKATELGVTEIVPLETERAVQVSTRLRPDHVLKLERRALEALKQCGGAWAPRIASPRSLATALGALAVPVRWLADYAGEGSPSPAAPAGIAIAVGPEGGFTADERSLLIERRFIPVRLTALTLRFETAAIAAVSLVAHHRARGVHD